MEKFTEKKNGNYESKNFLIVPTLTRATLFKKDNRGDLVLPYIMEACVVDCIKKAQQLSRDY